MRINQSFFLPKFFFIITLAVLSLPSFASFYQADTMAEYCREYIKLIELKSSVSQLEAGVCSGYVASSIEIMDLSGRLCDRSKINLDDVVTQYVTHVENNADAKKQTATYVLVELLQEKYSCDQP
ncbi:MAG: Rap1a/Tai family immunity protein [Gammaproteobacteria bacterium]